MSDHPPFGEATDDAVSASIDGELDAFAAEHGMTVDELTRRLSEWRGFEARRRELGDARAAVATELPPLEPLVRRQLVHKAKALGRPAASARTGRQRPVWRPLVVVAAAVAVVIAAGVGLAQLGGGGSGSSASKTASGTAGPKVESGAFVGEVGDVSQPNALRTLLTSRLAGLPTHASDPTSQSASGQIARAPAPSGRSAPGGTSTTAATGGREAALRCAPVVDPAVSGASPDPVVLLATATFHGRQAVVVGVRRGARSIVFVADRATCNVLTSQSV
jgi:hypothetical protein